MSPSAQFRQALEYSPIGTTFMKKHPSLPRAGLLALILSALTLAGCGRDESPKPAASAYNSASTEKAEGKPAATSEKPAEAGGEAEHGAEGVLTLSPEQSAAAGIKTAEIQEQEIAEQLTLTATIRPDQDRITHVAPRVSGRIVKVQANLGDSVKAGQTLAVLDSLEVGEAHSAWLQARTAYQVAMADFERAEMLHGEQIIAQKDHLRAHAEYEKSKAALAAAADKLRMLGVNPAPSADGKAVSTFPLTSSLAGTVIEKHAIHGELAEPDKQIFTVADLSKLWIEANLFEKDLGRVKVGADATVTVAAYPDAVFHGKLTYIAAVVDKETRTVAARVEVANPDGRLKPEMFATAAIHTGGKGKGLLLPDEALVLLQGQPTVFVREKDGYAPRKSPAGPSSSPGSPPASRWSPPAPTP